MPDKWKKILRKHGKRILIGMGCALAALICILTVANAQKLQDVFNPDLYVDRLDKNENTVEYDSSIFGSQQDNDNGLEMDEQAQDDYELDEGEENILDEQNEDYLGDGSSQESGSSQGLQIGTQTGNTAGSENVLGVTDDKNANTILVPNSGNTDNDSNLAGNDPNGGQGGSGGNGGSGNNPGGDPDPGGSGGTITPTPQPTPTPTPDPDEDRYGTDYKAPEHVVSDYPSPVIDENKKITVEKLTVTGSLEQHFYKGEFPRCDEMTKYITVTAVMSDGSVRANLKFIPFEGKGSGGDYSVDWSASKDEAVEGVGSEVGDAYEATITYRNKSVKLSYDIVDWQLVLKDFDESAMEGVDDAYEEFDWPLSPVDSPIIDLDNPMQYMYNLIYDRTDANVYSGTQYKYVNVQPNPWDSYYTEYFGGWSNGTVNCGLLYKMERPTDSQIENGVYKVELEPIWEKVEDQTDYIIGLDGNPWFTRWRKKLLGYTGDSEVLQVPEGVNIVNIQEMQQYMADNYWETENDTVKKIELPASITEYSNGFGFDDTYVNFFSNLQEYDVAKENQTYMSIDGVIYDKTGQILYNVPPAKAAINKWSKNVYWIAADSFQHTDMENVNVPASVCKLNGYAFLNANIGTLTLNCTNELELDTSVFDCNQFDADGNPLMSIRKIIVKTDKFAMAEGTNLFASLSEHKIDVSEQGLKIVQEIDSQDVDKNQAYLSAFKTLQAGIDIYNGNLNCTNTIFTTSDKTEDQYLYKDGFMMSKDGSRLYFVSAILEGDIRLPEGIKVIIGDAFEKCNEINTAVIPNSVVSIETNAFADAKALSVLYLYGDSPGVIGSKIFGDTIKDGFKIYVSETADVEDDKKVLDNDYGEGTGDKVFAVMEDMENKVLDHGNVYLKNEGEDSYTLLSVKPSTEGVFEPMAGTTVFADECFKDCANMQGIIIPETVVSIGSRAFSGCGSLQVIAANAVTAPVAENDTFDGVDISQMALFVPDTAGAKETYESGNWNGFASMDAPEVSYISEEQNVVNGAIYGVKAEGYNLVHAFVNEWGIYTLKDNTREIYNGAFRDCDSLTGINNSNNVTKIGEYAFAECDALCGVELLSSSEITLGRGAFKNCPSFTSFFVADGEWEGVYIPVTIKSLPDECFEGWGWWGDVIINGNMTYVGENCFANASSISSITFKGTVDQMGAGCFQGCSSLMTITSHDPAESEFSGFYYATPFGLDKIPDNCFNGCSYLGMGCGEYNIVSIQSESIGNYAFAGCESIRYLEFPMNITQLGEGSFQGCAGLSTLSSQVPDGDPSDEDGDGWVFEALPYSVNHIPAHCFENCTSLESVKILGPVESVGADAFGGDISLSKVSFTDIACIDPDKDSVESICDAYFKECPLTSLIVNGIEMMGDPIEAAAESLELEANTEAEKEAGLEAEQDADPDADQDADPDADLEVDAGIDLGVDPGAGPEADQDEKLDGDCESDTVKDSEAAVGTDPETGLETGPDGADEAAQEGNDGSDLEGDAGAGQEGSAGAGPEKNAEMKEVG